ncbi:hypothetical protein TRV_01720 [Trichophyton verrucosum HKI 0517]|uniref:Uncharacterized protein n=1 Tax=Trichophyton verrucosum (strain HKI 0517) TaxID=663202 RepID=D4D3Q9_TRIVH|nr:uncharacterized protein TRV_01720 [Trichophyton verrucosum HKI 0517]EFE43510.1 hypothetical protein TRV_01720 [Trichophyton verrucosum HKI 0517]
MAKNWCWACVDSVLKRWPAFMRKNGAGRRKEKPQGGKRESAGRRRKSKESGHAAIAFSSSRVTEKQSDKEKWKKGGSRKKSKGERRVEQSKSKSKVEIEGRRKKGDGAAGGSDRKPAVVKLG